MLDSIIELYGEIEGRHRFLLQKIKDWLCVEHAFDSADFKIDNNALQYLNYSIIPVLGKNTVIVDKKEIDIKDLPNYLIYDTAQKV